MNNLNRIYPPNKITIREVGLRDGLQLSKSYPSTKKKIEWISKEYAAGLKHFEVGSFLPISHAPQFADVREIIDAVNLNQDAHSIALALNERGATDALNTNVGEITVVISASEDHNLANAKRTRAKSLLEIKNVVKLRNESQKNIIINVGIASSFGCSISGEVAEEEVLRIVDRCLEAGVDMVGVADTVGYAGPKQISTLCNKLTKQLGHIPYVVHLHDTRGMGIANASAALDAGCKVFDASLAGLGGCPFAPGATGNVVLEDIIFLMESMGFSTDLDIEEIVKVRSIISSEMPEETLYGALAKAGLPKTSKWNSKKYF